MVLWPLDKVVIAPAGPAICNAIYAATGERIRQLPISAQGFKI